MEVRGWKNRMFHWVACLLVLTCACNVVIAHAQGIVAKLPETARGTFEFSGRMMYYPANPVWYPTLQEACEEHAAYLAGIRSDFAGAYCVKTYVQPSNTSGYWYISIAFPNWHLWSGELAVVTEASVNVRVVCPSGYLGGSTVWDYTTTPRSMVAVCGRSAFCPANATGKPANNPTVCTCNDGYAPDPTGTSCEQDDYTIELDRHEATVEPFGTTAGNAKTAQAFTATVKSNGTPKSGARITIRADVREKSGYHNHHDNKRPKGSLGSRNNTATACGAAGETQACITGATNDNGQFTFSFTSSQVSGEHTLTATCEQCAGNPDRAEIKVMVEGLSQIPASTFYTFVGKKDEHQNNHNLTPEAAAVLWKLAVSYQIEQQFKLKNSATGKFTITPPVLHVNDASLEWGGLFDAVNSNWAQPHGEHRRGTVIDLRANNAPGAISMKNFKKVDGILNELEVSYLHECTKDKKSTPKANRHNRKWPGCISELDASSDTNRHYHVRLMGVAE